MTHCLENIPHTERKRLAQEELRTFNPIKQIGWRAWIWVHVHWQRFVFIHVHIPSQGVPRGLQWAGDPDRCWYYWIDTLTPANLRVRFPPQYFCLRGAPNMGTTGRERPKAELKWIFFVWFKDQPVGTREMFSKGHRKVWKTVGLFWTLQWRLQIYYWNSLTWWAALQWLLFSSIFLQKKKILPSAL